jgi:TIGR03440 family protein|nr:MAG: ergothioneine biosynthesis protein EgtB [Pseudomonadota bacterium]
MPVISAFSDTCRAPDDVLACYTRIRAATGLLCRPLAPEDCVVQSMPDASPAKWHLAHTSWFFEEFVLRRFAAQYRLFDERYSFLFNSYYQTVGPMHERPRRGLLSRPTVQEILAYRAHVDEHMHELLARRGEHAELADLTTLGLHHEQQHQELLLTDIKHLFSCNPLLPAYSETRAPPRRTSPPLTWHRFDGGLADIGFAGEGFCFDNEMPRHRVFLEPFELASRPVTNEEFREFVLDGGYRRATLWLSDGWTIVQHEGWRHPLYWNDSLDAEFTLSGLRELDPQAPVCHVSYYEADAFARWAEARLPTEQEWEAAAGAVPVSGNFADSAYLHPIPAAPPAKENASHALLQIFGDVWEWTASAYAPYPGYAPLPGALGEYNGKFMVNQLVLRGGSCATPPGHARASYRNFLQPAARWQFSGARLARSVR